MHRTQPPPQEDICREGLTLPKLLQPARLSLPSNTFACVKVEKFTDIDIARINALLHLRIQGMIVDVDECIAPHHGEIAPENIQAIIRLIEEGIRMSIYSNMKDNGRYDSIQRATGGRVRIHRSRFAKPDPRGFMECCDAMELPPENVLMVGDNLVTDGGAIRAGMPMALVRPYPTEGESTTQRIKRFPQRACRRGARMLSDFYDVILQRKTVTSDQLNPRLPQ